MAEGQPRITNAGTRAVAAYALMIGALVLLYLWIRSYGDTLGAPAPLGSNIFGSAASRASQGDLLHVLLALVVVIATARAMGWVFRSANQPPVVGEILAGIVLGPSLLGRLAPGAEGYLFPGDGRALPQYHRAGRRHPLYVPGRARARSRAAAQTRPRDRRHLAREHHRCRSCSARRSRFIFIPSSRPATCRSPASRFSSASRCR